MKKAFLLYGIFAASGALSPLAADDLKITPSLGYDYVTGSRGYYSHGGTAGLAFALPNRDHLAVQFSVARDQDYSGTRSLGFQYKRRLRPDWRLGVGVRRSEGKWKDSADTVVSTALEAKSIHMISDALDGTLGYRFARGGLTEGTARGAALGRIETWKVRSPFTSHAFSGRLDHWALLRAKSLFSAAGLSAAYHEYDDSWTFTEEIELSYEWVKGWYGGVSYALTQNADREDDRYAGFFLTRYF